MSYDFFRMISQAAFSNPFTDRRVEIDRKIVGAANSTDLHDTLPSLLQKLGDYLVARRCGLLGAVAVVIREAGIDDGLADRQTAGTTETT